MVLWDNALVDIDSVDMSDSMQEALLRSNLEMRYTWLSGDIRKEVPLHGLPALSILKLDLPLVSYVDLLRVLFEEEKTAYNEAILQSMRIKKIQIIHIVVMSKVPNKRCNSKEWEGKMLDMYGISSQCGSLKMLLSPQTIKVVALSCATTDPPLSNCFEQFRKSSTNGKLSFPSCRGRINEHSIINAARNYLNGKKKGLFARGV